MRALLVRYNPLVLLALALALAYHGALLLSGTYRGSYDAYVHIFFADHYMRAWFDHWEPRWYTGFSMTSYPPGAQQLIALFAYVVGLQNGFVIVAIGAILNLTLGVYRFSKLWVSEEAAGYASLLVVFASCIAETLHVFGQLPTLFALGFLLNGLPFVRRWLDDGKLKWLITAWLFNAATTAGHHVTTLFGAVFFVAPVIIAAFVEALRTPLPDEPTQQPTEVTRKNLRPLLVRRLRRVWPVVVRAGIYVPGAIFTLVCTVLPYWLWSQSDPITQVPIPHASRDSFILNPNAGLIFWLVPYGLSLVALPYVVYKGLTTRVWPMTISFAILFLLGTGGTTPLPKLLLGGAFEVLTLDRFTFWATITMLPLLGEFVVSLRHGGLARYIREQFGDLSLPLVQIGLAIAYLVIALLVANLTQFRRFQPAPIDMQPIVTFLEKDQHWRWRYLALGFGDQMAWLAAQTTANSVDGDYHSARRLPELTSAPVERLEGAKYSGIPGIGSLQQFIAVPEKYNLKFIFSNDQFYDPLLFFSGWHRLQRLENGIMVWERADIPPLPEVLPRKEIPYYQRLMWGIIPMTAIISALFAFALPLWWTTDHGRWTIGVRYRLSSIVDSRLRRWSALPEDDDSAVVAWQGWRDWAKRVPRPRPATPTAQQVRLGLLIMIGLAMIGSGAIWYVRQARTPMAVLQQYYDDLDFRRFDAAYARLDPATRPPLDQYLVDLSLQDGMVASYGKLDNLRVQVLTSEPEQITAAVQTDWVTSLSTYHTTQTVRMLLRDGTWYIVPDPVDATVPPEPFIRRGAVEWGQVEQPRSTDDSSIIHDALDRPALQILSARLVRRDGRYSVVGELINTSSDPADVTVTAFLRDAAGTELSRYNAQEAMIHTLLPKATTPFRVDFEGVAGAVLSDTLDLATFKPGTFTPPALTRPVARFDVYAKAVVTSYDLNRSLTAQDLQVRVDADNGAHLTGVLLNTGTQAATIPHILLTFYDQDNHVVWVDHAYLRDAVRPQHAEPFDLPLTSYVNVQTISPTGGLFTTISQPEVSLESVWRERILLPNGLGFSSLRVSVHAFEGGSQ